MQDTVLALDSVSFWRVTIVFALLGLAWLFTRIGLGSTTSKLRRILLLGLRVVSFIVVGVLILEPVLQRRQLTPLKSRLAILVDGSESMGIKEGKSSRAEQLVEFLEKRRMQVEELANNFSLETYSFSSKLVSATLDQLGKSTSGKKTDIVTALSSLLVPEKSSESDLSAIVMFSDGVDTEWLKEVDFDRSLPKTVTKMLSSLEVPVNTFFVGQKADFIDLAVLDVAFDDFAFSIFH